MKQQFLLALVVAVLCLNVGTVSLLASQDAPAQKNEEPGKKEEPKEKEEEAVDIEEAEKQAQKPVPNVGYTKEEYDQFQTAFSLPDLEARAAGLSQFIKSRPNSKLNEHAMAAYAALLNQLYQQKDMAKLAPAAEGFLELKPGDVAALGLATEAAYSNKDYAKAIKHGESFYQAKPSKEVAQLLAHSFDQLKSPAKFASYAEKCISEMAPKDAFFYAAKLSHYYGGQRNIPKAALYSQKMMSAYSDQEIPTGYAAAQWSQEKGRSYSIIGRAAYDRKQYGAAVSAYHKSLRNFSGNDEAYYYLGMSYWSAQDTTNAMKNLAKAALLNKSYAKTARAQLEVLYKGLNNGSLDGIDRVTRAASAELK
ncbi:MAG: tetratricopeptide repeat protein [Acidimicrobiia bacterium]|nr:tetratricopeptide repeat protein [Acidimicrobiia bacterium]